MDAGSDDYIAVVTIGLTKPEAKEPLLELLIREVERWVQFQPGFCSATYHVSADGTRILNYARWKSLDSYQESFRANPGSRSMRDAITGIDGVASLEMTGYTIARSVMAAANPPDSFISG